MVRVLPVVRPRSETAVAPVAKLKPLQFWFIEPALFADKDWTASEIVLTPRLARSSELITVTGEAVAAAALRKSVPVITISLSPEFAAGVASAGAAACANAGAASARLRAAVLALSKARLKIF